MELAWLGWPWGSFARKPCKVPSGTLLLEIRCDQWLPGDCGVWGEQWEPALLWGEEGRKVANSEEILGRVPLGSSLGGLPLPGAFLAQGTRAVTAGMGKGKEQGWEFSTHLLHRDG